MNEEHDIASDTSSDEEYMKAKRKRKRLTRGRQIHDVMEEEIQWSCSKCTFLNQPLNRVCELCDGSRVCTKSSVSIGSTTRQKKTVKMKSVDEKTSQPQNKDRIVKPSQDIPWNCDACTYLNVNHSDKCELCDSTRNVLKIEKSTNGMKQSLMEAIDSSDDEDKSIQIPSKSSLHYNDAFTLWNDKYQPKKLSDVCVHPKKTQEVQEWFTTMSRHHRLLFICGPPGIGKSTLVRALAGELGYIVQEWKDTNGLTQHMYKTAASAMDDLGSFIDRSQRYPSLAFGTKPMVKEELHIILVEEWPTHHTSHRVEFQQILHRLLHARNHAAPMVIVYSDVHEGKVTSAMLAKEFSAQVVQSPLTHIIHCNPIAPGMMKKYLTQISRKENLSITPLELSQIVEQSHGDIRHALNSLQFQQMGGSRDPFLSDFHLLGKLLHRKESACDGRLTQCSMDSSHILATLHQNCIPCFTEIDELTNALDYMSFVDSLVESVYFDRSNSNYYQLTQHFANSILERTFHVTNQHPAPSSFRPLVRPRNFRSTIPHDPNHKKQETSWFKDIGPYLKWLQVRNDIATEKQVEFQETDDEIDNDSE